jgi:hypothetical protein
MYAFRSEKHLNKLSKNAKIVPAVKEVISEFPSIRLTLRQIFYRLVTKGILKNQRNQYNVLSMELVKARWRGLIPFSAIEDQNREVIGGESYRFTSPEGVFEDAKETFESAEDTFNGCADDFWVPLWHKQLYHIEVWLEKQALANLFQQVTDSYHARLAPCKGYPSLTFLYESAQYLKYYVPHDKQIVILYFGDYDVRGLDIQRDVANRLQHLGLDDLQIERVALTKEQIQQYNLPPAPAKKTDCMAFGWIESQGDVAWELDALEPKTLQKLIKEAIENYLDKQVYALRNVEIELGKARIQELLDQYNDGHEG